MSTILPCDMVLRDGKLTRESWHEFRRTGSNWACMWCGATPSGGVRRQMENQRRNGVIK